MLANDPKIISADRLRMLPPNDKRMVFQDQNSSPLNPNHEFEKESPQVYHKMKYNSREEIMTEKLRLRQEQLERRLRAAAEAMDSKRESEQYIMGSSYDEGRYDQYDVIMV